ncbi:EthD domain-containing protein [Microdochium trichocladiopsis]|uniref:EthD domain-containing protein n=1 Tax=Microdochium trichocladiopsis TaxID=1682393 RepID=A0A9P8XTN2_9PEZI|nr:EthD domain-containing protein [Microdochium trichocladiopsis]KAH7014376.1 EthD domain-containing protein [Microdochium trichocladiopsis]
MPTEKLVRITTLIPRKKGMSQADFYKHWSTVHGPMVVDFMMRHGVVEYRQYHTTPEMKALGEALAKAAGRPMLEYDGISDAYVRDFQAFQESAFKDPEYTEKIQPDELRFIDVENIQMTIGYDYWVIENGKPVLGGQESGLPK